MTTTNDAPARDTADMSLAELRAEFRILKRNAMHEAAESEWMAKVEKNARALAEGDEPEPCEWVDSTSASRVFTTCGKCRGAGVYCWGAVINGRPTHTGECFRCGGKGYQNQSDYRRNFGHDNYTIRSAFQGMINSPSTIADDI